MKLPVSVIIIAQNEAPNIDAAIRSVVHDFKQVVVVDSYSNDNTAEICRTYSEVLVFQNKFIDWANQRNWALANCAISSDIVFFLDADEYITPGFVDELRGVLDSRINFSAIMMFPEYIFMGKRLNYAYGHPKIRRIFKKSGLRFYCEGARERAVSAGTILEMNMPFVHHDHKPLASWISKHTANAEKEAEFYLSVRSPRKAEVLPRDLQFRICLREKVWDRLPLLGRPYLYFFYRYIVKLGFLDGKPGLIYCFFHALWYPTLIDTMIIEKTAIEKD